MRIKQSMWIFLAADHTTGELQEEPDKSWQEEVGERKTSERRDGDISARAPC